MHLTSQIRPYLRAPLGIAAGLLALLCGVALATGQAQGAAAGEERPSFVVIQTDDATLDGLYATFNAYGGAPATRAMPNTIDLLAKRGMTFNRYYVSYPLCCPSRTSLLTGRYAHNHNVRGNVPPEGGFTGFSIRKAFSHNIATWLQGAGYRTIHVGKFLNGYGDEPFDNGTTVPPGWSAWHSVLKADTDHYYYGYRLNNNGAISPPYGDSGSWDTREYGVRDDPGCPLAPLNGLPCLYATDVFTSMAAQEIEGTSPTRPFYLQLDYTAPHGDFRRPAGPEPAPRHYDWFWGAKVPHDRSEGLNEGNANDKPSFIRNAPYLSGTELRIYRVYWEKQLDSLRSIDDGVAAIVKTLGKMQRLRNTYIVFTSDNGFFFGEHRLAGGKFLAYEPATHLPLIIRGPGIQPSSATGELAANIDIAPTVLELAGVKADQSIDGRSLVPYLGDSGLRTRRPILFESFVQTRDVEAQGGRATREVEQQGQRLDHRPAQGLRGDPPRPLQVHRLADRGERALRHQQGPQRAEQPRQDAELLPGPQLPRPGNAAARDLLRQELPTGSAGSAAYPQGAGARAGQAEEGTAGKAARAQRVGG